LPCSPTTWKGGSWPAPAYARRYTQATGARVVWQTGESDDIQKFEPGNSFEGPNHVTVLGWEQTSQAQRQGLRERVGTRLHLSRMEKSAGGSARLTRPPTSRQKIARCAKAIARTGGAWRVARCRLRVSYSRQVRVVYFWPQKSSGLAFGVTRATPANSEAHFFVQDTAAMLGLPL